MTPANLLILKKAVTATRSLVTYIERDQRVMLGLTKPVWAEFEGPGIGRGNYDNGIFKIISKPDGNKIRMECNPFSPELGIWNGPDILNNKIKDGRLESSLWHDLVWVNVQAIADAFGMPVIEVLKWANALFAAAWKGYAVQYPPQPYTKHKIRLAYGSTQFAAPWYHWLKRLFGMAVISIMVTGCTSCALFEAPPEDVIMTGSSGTFYHDVESVEPWITTNIVEGVR